MADFAPELKKRLREAGCYFVRQGKGDHEVWRSPISGQHFPVDHKIKSRHTANGVLKHAGLPKGVLSRRFTPETCRVLELACIFRVIPVTWPVVGPDASTQDNRRTSPAFQPQRRGADREGVHAHESESSAARRRRLAD